MKLIKKNNEGYTLLELMITILIGSIITLATTTILLLGLRLNNESADTVKKQNTSRILLSALEDLATEGTILEVEVTSQSWVIKGESGVIYSYDSETAAIYAGTSGTPLLENIIASHVMQDGQLLSFAFEVEGSTYSSSVYCRTLPIVKNQEAENLVKEETITNNVTVTELDETEKQARITFLKKVVSQHGSRGYIMSNDGSGTLQYYSQWYIGSGNWGIDKDWNQDTPWCACFVSWALAQKDVANCIINVNTDLPELRNSLELIPCYSKVEDFVQYKENGYQWKSVEEGYVPIPGDLIVFDWDPEKENGNDHIGIVLNVDNDTIYTIEGNTANMVAVRSYKADDPDIVGYGVLDWKQNP